MYTIKVCNDNSVLTTIYQKLLQSERIVNSIHVLVPKDYSTLIYGDMDMSEFTATLYYLLPSDTENDFKSLTLIRSEELYKDNYVEFIVPEDKTLMNDGDYLSSESGYVRYKLVFTKVGETVEDSDGNEVTELFWRETLPNVMYITSVSMDKDTMNIPIDSQSQNNNTKNVNPTNKTIYVTSESGYKLIRI